ncbi:type II secretion system F family protein [Candidatus Saccharibacteria bacterium]|nr:type II secretion system F family protein [Candidatus Saccharibacteria bacterium]MDQ5885294.1 type pilus assembly protein PilC [Patescibacteria group bacterium]MDQ5953590.1 type pilus assembly protein PilC [Patescibacteria group bacterium]MDQ5958649.1 type pilus assembly protein PilC [Patescibacteria group bacterium]
MSKYKFKGLDKNGKVQTGSIEASSESVVIQTLSKQHIKPLTISRVSETNILKRFRKKVKSKDVSIFTRQLSTMVSAGIPLSRSFHTLEQQTNNRYFQSVIADLAKQIEGGTNIADALSKYPNVFDDVYVNMVKAGEAGGILDEILKRLATQLEKDQSIKKKVKSATTYPKVIFGITIIAFIVVMNLIVPKIGGMLLELGGPDAKLPLLTRVMIGLSDFSKQYAIFIIIFLLIAIYVFRRYVKTPKGKLKYHQFLLKIPIVNNLIIKVAIARFSRMFSSLMSSGVNVIESIEITAASMGNKVLENELLDAANEVKAGKQLSEPISKSKHFPAIVSQMLAIGEETGETDKILVKIADFYEEEVDTTIESLSSILEPLMIVILGGMVGLVAASVMGPMASLSSGVTK